MLRTIDDITTIIEKGYCVSEVGFPKMISSTIGSIPVFSLRDGRSSSKWPSHRFGKIEIGECFASFIPIRFNIPNAGSSIILDPVMSEAQMTLLNMFEGVSADAIWHINIPSPLGLALLMRLSAPEISLSTETRGVRYKATQMPGITVSVPWHSQLAYQQHASTAGHTGLSLKITTLQMNKDTGIPSPIQALAWVLVTNVRGHSLRNQAQSITDVPGSFKFTPVTATASTFEEKEDLVVARFQADNDQGAAGVIGDEQEGSPVETTPISDDVTVTAPPEVITAESTSSVGKTTPVKDNTAAIQQKFILLSRTRLSQADVGVAKTFAIQPATRSELGEGLGLPWRRNVWTLGSFSGGYTTSLEYKVESASMPGIAGQVLLQPTLGSGIDFIGERVWHQLGGEPTTIKVPYTAHIASAGRLPRDLNRPVILASQAVASMSMTLYAMNRNTTEDSLEVTVWGRPGDAQFHTPVKARRAPTTTSQARARLAVSNGTAMTAKDINAIGTILQNIRLDVPEARFQADDDAGTSAHSLVPVSAEFPVQGEVGPEYLFDQDEISQDDFWIELPPVVLNGSTISVVPYSLIGMEDVQGAGGLNPWEERATRFACMRPTRFGNMGPAFGTYKLVARLPTTCTADIAHVAIPADMAADIATRLFGLDSLLSIAGSALTSIGGPLLSGAIDTIGNVVKDVPIIGNIASGIKDVLGGILGGSSKTDEPATPKQENYPSIDGLLQMARHFEFLRTNDSDIASNDAFGNLLLQLQNTMGLPTNTAGEPTMSVRPFMNMGNMAEWARSVFDRSVLPTRNARFALMIEIPEVGYLLTRLVEQENVDNYSRATAAIGWLAEEWDENPRALVPMEAMLSYEYQRRVPIVGFLMRIRLLPTTS